jgi:hypothetical protein
MAKPKFVPNGAWLLVLLGLAVCVFAVVEPWTRSAPVSLAYTALVVYYYVVRRRRR